MSLEIGGSNDIANLFPEKLNANPGYPAKDSRVPNSSSVLPFGVAVNRPGRQRLNNFVPGFRTGLTGRLSRHFPDRGGRTRTCNPRFWRPVLCQLSYAPRFAAVIVQGD